MEYQYLESEAKKYNEEVQNGNLLSAIAILKEQIETNLINVNNSIANEKIHDIIELYDVLAYGKSAKMKEFLPIYEKFIGMNEFFSFAEVELDYILSEYIKLESELKEKIEKNI